MFRRVCCRLLLSVAVVATLGCNSNTSSHKGDTHSESEESHEGHAHSKGESHKGHTHSHAKEPAKESDHHHGDGPHGGVIIEWGGKYHVEFTADHDKKEAVMYILGGDEKTPAPIKVEKIYLTIDDPPTEIEAVAQPLEGEADGLSSRFVGTHDTLGIVKEYSGTISGVVDGIPYSEEFKEHAH